MDIYKSGVEAEVEGADGGVGGVGGDGGGGLRSCVRDRCRFECCLRG